MQVVFIDEKEEARFINSIIIIIMNSYQNELHVHIHVLFPHNRGDIETRLKMCYDRFKQLKIDNSWKMKEEIEERARFYLCLYLLIVYLSWYCDRFSSRLLQLKLNELRFGPNPIRQFNIMRDKAKLIVKQEKQERDNKPKWYNLHCIHVYFYMYICMYFYTYMHMHNYNNFRFLIIQNEVQSTLKSNSSYDSGLLYLEKLDLFTTAHTNEINHVLVSPHTHIIIYIIIVHSIGEILLIFHVNTSPHCLYYTIN